MKGNQKAHGELSIRLSIQDGLGILLSVKIITSTSK